MAQTVQPLTSMRNRFKASGSAGFSLVELLIVIVIIGLIMLFAFPRAGLILDHTNVRGARTAIVNKINSARTAARTSNQVAVFRFANDSIWLELNAMTGTAKTRVGGATSLSQQYSVSVTGPDSIGFDPRGMMKNYGLGPYTLVVTKNGWKDSVVVNSYGRITR